MEDLETSRERPDWVRLFTDGQASKTDLFDFAKDIFHSHKTPPGVNIELPEIRRTKINVADPDDTSSESIPGQTIVTGDDEDAPLHWGKEGTIRLDYQQGEDKGTEVISFDFESSSKRRASRENFDLVKSASGEITAIWYRGERTHSYLLGEDLDDDSFEVTLDTKKIKRIGSVLLSAHARTSIEKAG